MAKSNPSDVAQKTRITSRAAIEFVTVFGTFWYSNYVIRENTKRGCNHQLKSRTLLYPQGESYQ